MTLKSSDSACRLTLARRSPGSPRAAGSGGGGGSRVILKRTTKIRRKHKADNDDDEDDNELANVKRAERGGCRKRGNGEEEERGMGKEGSYTRSTKNGILDWTCLKAGWCNRKG
ncbi:hypothetical protein V1478_017606 [Vespula squamosa]|uniref:Uncharacterized protein n=1 Tax=Vespula squamosa TaxID=30214 RepID=A0ABD1ZWA1_VESSQ